MNVEHLATFVIAFTGAGLLLSVILALPGKKQGRWSRILVALVLFGGGVAAASAALPGRNSVVQLLTHLAHFTRLHVAALAAGTFCGLLAGLALDGLNSTRWRRLLGCGLYTGAVTFLVFLTLREVLSPYLATP